MPSARRSYIRVLKILNERAFLKLLESKKKKEVMFSDLNNINKTVLLKNEILEPIYEPDTDTLHCRVCGSQVFKQFLFCPYCSQKIK